MCTIDEKAAVHSADHAGADAPHLRFFRAHSTTAALKSQFFSPNRQKTDDNRHIS